MRGHVVSLLGIGLCLSAWSTDHFLPPNSSTEKAKIIGQPASILVQPSTVSFTSLRNVQQLIVTGKYPDGSVRDLSAVVQAEIMGNHVTLEDGLFLQAVRPGSGNIVIRAGSLKAIVPVTVNVTEKAEPVSFRNDLMAVLNVGGCNQGACHGNPNGKNGFKLSLRGFDPADDYLQLTHDLFGRRSNKQQPESSLIYLKALGRVPHEGGVRFAPSSLAARTLSAWLAEGAKNDLSTSAVLNKVEVLPGSRVLLEPSRWQQLAVLGHFSDGQVRDVTRLTVFSSSDPAIANVSSHGLVEFRQGGEVAILCRYLEEMVPVRLTYLPSKPGFQWSNPAESNYIDTHVFAKLEMLSIAPSQLCNDYEFIRRSFMDVCGVLPTPTEIREFMASKEPDKRAKLIDQLLQRPEFADFWTLKWSDVLRNSRKVLGIKGAQDYHKWLRDRINDNVPFDKVVHELITAEGNIQKNPATSYYRITREPTALAETTAQLFFGVRLQCAKCHNHPYERWSQNDYHTMAAFFAQVKQKTEGKGKDAQQFIYVDKDATIMHPHTGKPAEPKFFGEPLMKVPADKERRVALAEWLISPQNPLVAKSIVNRIWYHLLGRGIVDPVDDFRDSNPSANDALLDALARDFVANKFDVKHIIRTIMNSRTYQLSTRTNEFNKDDNKYFSHAIVRRHSAEPLFDALCYATDVPEKFVIMVRKNQDLVPSETLPIGTRAVQLFDGQFNHPFLKAFGQPARELACECEREPDSNLPQTLELINGPSVNERIRDPNNRIFKLLDSRMSDREKLEELYLVTLSRPPLPAEAKALLAHVAATRDQRTAWEDVLWTLINAKEFAYRH